MTTPVRDPATRRFVGRLDDLVFIEEKFNESDWVRNRGRFADYVGQSGGGGGAGGAGKELPVRKNAVGYVPPSKRLGRKFKNPEDFVDNAMVKDLEALYASDPPFETNGSLIRDSISGKRFLTANISIIDSTDGTPVANLTRTFHQDGSVYHSHFDVHEGLQGEGFAAAVNSRAEYHYQSMGFTHIDLVANIDVGTYAWARQGYDFKGLDSLGEGYFVSYYKDVYSNEMSQKGIDPEGRAERLFGDRTSIHAWEVAALDDGETYAYATYAKSGEGHVGKALMLNGESWLGTKSLDPDSDSYKVGHAYYRQKGVR